MTSTSTRIKAVMTVAAQYAAAILAIVVTTAAMLPIREVLGAPIAALLYLLPIGMTTWIWGLGPGVAASFSAFLAFN